MEKINMAPNLSCGTLSFVLGLRHSSCHAINHLNLLLLHLQLLLIQIHHYDVHVISIGDWICTEARFDPQVCERWPAPGHRDQGHYSNLKPNPSTPCLLSGTGRLRYQQKHFHHAGSTHIC